MGWEETEVVVNGQDCFLFSELRRDKRDTEIRLHTNKIVTTAGQANYDYGVYPANGGNSVIGRWLQVGPLGNNRPGLTPYNYVQNNPLIRFDPDGRTDWKAAIWAGLRIAGGATAYGIGKALIIKGGIEAAATLGLSLVQVAAGISISTTGAYNVAAGINDWGMAMITPDGMTAETTKALWESLLLEFGTKKSTAKAFGILEGILAGNYKIGKDLIDGKVLEAMIKGGEITKDTIEWFILLP